MTSRPADLKQIEQAEAEHEYREAQADRNFAAEVLRRQIDWKHYGNEGKLSVKEVNLILGYDQQAPSTQQDYLDEFGPALAGLFVKILHSIASLEVQEYTIILIDQLFSADKSPEAIRQATDYFLTFKRDNPKVELAQPFMSILTSSGQHNPFTFLRVQHILATLLAAAYAGSGSSLSDSESASAEEKAQRLTLVQFLRYLIAKISHLSGSSAAPGGGSTSSSVSLGYGYGAPTSPTSSNAANNRELMACLASLKNLLRSSPRIQLLFAEQDGIRALASLLNKETQNAQLLYLVGFNIWLLSYQQTMAVKLAECGVIKKLIAVVKVNVMEKVIRISFSILRNFLEHKTDSFNEDMIGHGLVSVVETLSKRKFKDPDIQSDMVRIGEVLAESIRHMSTFEKYSVEVQSGALSWSNPAHKSEIFWRENILAFEARNFALVARLTQLAEAAPVGTFVGAGAQEREESVREIACYDLGEFARFHPDGKKVAQRLKVKEVLMRNLQAASPKISKAALLATQKLMVGNWEMLNKASGGGVASLVSGPKKN